MKFVHQIFFFGGGGGVEKRTPGESLIDLVFIIKVLPRSMGFSACNDHMQTAKQYYSKCKWKNGGNHTIIEDKYATPRASFIDKSLTSQRAIAGICVIAVKEFRQKIIKNI